MKLFLWLSSTLFLLFSQNTWASSMQDIASAATRSTDKSRGILVTVFGNVVNNPLASSGAGDTVLASIFQVSNSCLLVVGGFLVIYVIFKKITQTAHDGNVFDREKHTLWSPIRMVIGLLSLVPTANGWSLSQLAMLWAASVMGVGIANLATDAALSSLEDGKSMVVQPIMPSTSDLAKNIFEINLCQHSINAGLAIAESQGALINTKGYVQQSSIKNGFILKNASFSCGGATINTNLEPIPSSTNWFSSSSSNWISPSFDISDINQAHLSALQEMQSTLSNSAKEFVQAVILRKEGNGNIPDAEIAIQSSAYQYENTINVAVGTKRGNIADLASKITSSMKSAGWITLGAWYQTFAQANTKLTDAIAAKATTFGSSQSGDPAIESIYKEVMSVFYTQQSHSDYVSPQGTSSSGDYSQGATGKEAGQIIGSIFSSPGQRIINGLIDINAGGEGLGQVNPLIKMKNIGDYTMVAGEIALGTYAMIKVANTVKDGFSMAGIAARIANAFTSIGDIISGLLDVFGPFITTAIMALFFFGAVLSIYIPLVPFVIWFGAIINWLVIVGEAIIAAPLWAITHLAGDGDGLGHRTSHGYIFLLNMMIRPVLMVIGFFLGGACVIAGGTFLNQMFGIAIANAQFDSITGLISVICYLAIYVFLCSNLIQSSFNLIFIVPDQVINWIGGHASVSLGKDENDKTKHNFNLFTGKAEHLPHGHLKERGKEMKSDGFKKS